MVFPKHPPFRAEAVLDGEFHGCDGLVGGCEFVPDDAGVFGWVVGGGGAELDFQSVFGGGGVEVIEEPGGNLRRVRRDGI